MATHAAFLRGINLGARRRVSGAQLRSLFSELAFDDPDAFRTSGNVVFGAGRESSARLTGRIEKGLADALGYEVVVFLRTADEVRAIAAAQPFPAAAMEASAGKLQVTMLLTKPGKRARDQVLALSTDQDRLAFGDRELYWLPSGGTRDSTLDRKAIEELLGSTTMRTMGTLELLAAKYFAG